MDILVIEGTPRQRGRIYGESLRQRIIDVMGKFWEGISQSAGISSRAIIANWMAETNYLPSIERWTPQLLEEVRGIGEGAGVDFDSIFAWQLLDEFNWYVDLFTSRKAAASGIGQCSTVGVFAEGDGITRLAQNWDSMILLSEYLTLLHVKDPSKGLETFVITSSGRIGPFGMNNRGTGICLNGLTEFLNSAGDGLPVIFVGRGALEQGASEAAACFVQKVRHATGQNYTIGGLQGLWMYEASANQVRHVPAGGTRLAHANHPLANDDLRISNRTPEVQKRNWEKTTTRYACMQKHLADHSQPVTVETIRTILGSHDSPDTPICRHAGTDGTISTTAGMIMELSSRPILHLAQAHPCQAEFKRFTFTA
jgi:isopenicillin-N N-acyltransferase like protein